MPDITASSARPGPRPVRAVADARVAALADLNPLLAAPHDLTSELASL